MKQRQINIVHAVIVWFVPNTTHYIKHSKSKAESNSCEKRDVLYDVFVDTQGHKFAQNVKYV